MGDFNVLVASGGRRPYLIRWFQEALEINGVTGRVFLADCDPLAPARAVADGFLLAPAIDDPRYEAWLATVLAERVISVAISIHDFELSKWSRLPVDERFASLIRLSADAQLIAEDKLAMSRLLADADVQSPATLLASEALQLTSKELSRMLGLGDRSEIVGSGEGFRGPAAEGQSRVPYSAESSRMRGPAELVVKGRYGSGSRGLHFASVEDLPWAVAKARHEVTERDGSPACCAEDPSTVDDLIVVQPRIHGQEYGLDVVSNLSGAYVATLPRKKLGMRGGETDRAVTVSTDRFEQIGARVSGALGHRGLIDLDLIRDEQGMQWVIDLNPRFGGGYPFSHAAGAHVPAAYVAWALGRNHQPDWVASTPDVIGAKVLEVLRVPVSSTGTASIHAMKEETV